MKDSREYLIVCGSAPCFKEDILLLKERCNREMKGEAHLLAAGLDVFKLNIVPWKYVATGHFEDIEFIRSYGNLHKQKGYKLISYQPFPHVDIVIPLMEWEGGSSALLGVMAGIKLNYNKIILCGVPLLGANPNHEGADYSMFQRKWVEVKDQLTSVRSMSGFTMDLLGEPTTEWLNDA